MPKPQDNEEIKELIGKIRERDQEQHEVDQLQEDAPDAATWHSGS